MAVFGWDMPPGTSFRVTHSRAMLECPKCEETVTVTSEHDHSVGAHTLLGAGAVCECGYEFTDDEVNDAEWETETEEDW